jgi:hypothetical protein
MYNDVDDDALKVEGREKAFAVGSSATAQSRREADDWTSMVIWKMASRVNRIVDGLQK